MVKRMVCPKCGMQGKPNDRFCGKCGILLVEKEVEDTNQKYRIKIFYFFHLVLKWLWI